TASIRDQIYCRAQTIVPGCAVCLRDCTLVFLLTTCLSAVAGGSRTPAGRHPPFLTTPIAILTMSTSPSTAGASAPSSSSNCAKTTTKDADALRQNRILSSKLYFDVPLYKAPVIYSTSYDIAFLGIEKLHPFDSSKWGRICQFLIANGVLDKTRIVEPLEATKDDLLVVHSEAYLRSLKSSLNVSIITEVGGTILAAKLAKERGCAINVGGGFHHCSADRGGGFCAYADISLCIHYAFIRLNISRVMIIDLDAHQGNGHEKDFSDDRRVYILDMYNPYIYPLDYEARRYIDQRVEVPVAEHAFDPELVIYNAGTDILDGDPLGRLRISPDGVTIRDEKVFRFVRDKNIPLVMLTSGSTTFFRNILFLRNG
ncbi:Histone deacetylase domain-containing protein, partial [Cynara cardunculus var. scolymus]